MKKIVVPPAACERFSGNDYSFDNTLYIRNYLLYMRLEAHYAAARSSREVDSEW
jgi:hypothetical protein